MPLTLLTSQYSLRYMPKSRRKSTPKTEQTPNTKQQGLTVANSVKTSGETPTRRIQPGGGYLQTGNPGNKGGGATPDALRGTIRRIIEEHGLPFLEAALSATGTVTCPHCKGKVEVPADPKLMAKLLDTGLRIGVGTQKEVEHKGMVLVMGKNLSE